MELRDEEMNQARSDDVKGDSRKEPARCAESQHQIEYRHNASENDPNNHFAKWFGTEDNGVEQATDHPGETENAEEEKF